MSPLTQTKGEISCFLYRLNDGDDDVKSVAASCLLPVAEHIVQQLPESLDQILVVLWHCLSNMRDDLSSSVGVVMDLLGKTIGNIMHESQLKFGE